jgi:hypothetical protein
MEREANKKALHRVIDTSLTMQKSMKNLKEMSRL